MGADRLPVQLGYVVAYTVFRVAAAVLGTWTGIVVGRVAAIVIQAAGGMMAVIVTGKLSIQSIRELEGDMEPAAK